MQSALQQFSERGRVNMYMYIVTWKTCPINERNPVIFISINVKPVIIRQSCDNSALYFSYVSTHFFKKKILALA